MLKGTVIATAAPDGRMVLALKREEKSAVYRCTAPSERERAREGSRRCCENEESVTAAK
jgi:hypothetical protein